MIKRSTHSFGAGYANSSIDAVWVAETYAEGMTESEDLAAETNTQSPMKCKMPEKEEGEETQQHKWGMDSNHPAGIAGSDVDMP